MEPERQQPYQDDHTTDSAPAVFVRRHQLAVMIAGSIVISLALVTVSMTLYSTSGTAQVDLSRPGLEKVREQVKSVDDYKGFSASGEITDKTLSEFDGLYAEQLKGATSVDAFNPDALSNEALGIDQPAADQ